MKLVLLPFPISPPFIVLSKFPYPSTPGADGGEAELAKSSPTLKGFKVPWEGLWAHTQTGCSAGTGDRGKAQVPESLAQCSCMSQLCLHFLSLSLDFVICKAKTPAHSLPWVEFEC